MAVQTNGLPPQLQLIGFYLPVYRCGLPPEQITYQLVAVVWFGIITERRKCALTFSFFLGPVFACTVFAAAVLAAAFAAWTLFTKACMEFEQT